jgi:hypothetical protein
MSTNHRKELELLERLAHLAEETNLSLNFIARELIENTREVKEQKFILGEIYKELQPQPQRLTAFIGVLFKSGDGTMAFNALTLNVGQTSQASIVPLLADGVTPSGATLSNVSYTFSDPSATVVLNPDGLTATVTGVATSTAGAVTGQAQCTTTDTDGVVAQFSQGFTITVGTVVPPSQLTQSIGVSFTTPTP